tara:strand:- start:3245 stop:3427 length:183 start_codon:yes stop_codon:yes gene_type:complete
MEIFCHPNSRRMIISLLLPFFYMLSDRNQLDKADFSLKSAHKPPFSKVLTLIEFKQSIPP